MRFDTRWCAKCAVGLPLLFAGVCSGQDCGVCFEERIPWIREGSGRWLDATNWQGGNVPDDRCESAIINPIVPAEVLVDDHIVNGAMLVGPLATVRLSPAATLELGVSGECNVQIDGSVQIEGDVFPRQTTMIIGDDARGEGVIELQARMEDIRGATLFLDSGMSLTRAITVRGSGRVAGHAINGITIHADQAGRDILVDETDGCPSFLIASPGNLEIRDSNICGSGTANSIIATAPGIVRLTGQAVQIGEYLLEGRIEVAGGMTVGLQSSDFSQQVGNILVINSDSTPHATTVTYTVNMDGAGTILLNASENMLDRARFELECAQIGSGIAFQGNGQIGANPCGEGHLNGILSPGRKDGGASLGRIDLDGQLRLGPEAHVEIDIDPSQEGGTDFIGGASSLMLDGLLEVRVASVAGLLSGSSIPLITGDSLSGAFSVIMITGSLASKFAVEVGTSEVHLLVGCLSDTNEDGTVDASDFFQFLDLLAAQDPRSDLDGDQFMDSDDFFAYLDFFAQGC